MKKLSAILLTLLFIFVHFQVDAKRPVPTKKTQRCETCEQISGRAALRDAVLKNTLSKVQVDRKIGQSDLIVSTLLLSAEHDLRKWDLKSAVAKANQAISFSEKSPLPHFFLAHLNRLTEKKSFLSALGEYATAIQLSIGNFFIMTTSIGIFLLVLMITFHLCLLTFLLYWFVYYLPLWVHYAKESLPLSIQGAIHRHVILGLIVFLLLVLFFLLPPFWFLWISLLLFWFFYQPQEKRIAVIFLVGLLLFSFLSKPILMLLTAKQSYLLDQMTANQSGNFLWSAPQFNAIEKDWKVPFIKASYSLQENRFAEADALYKQSLLENPDEKRLLNNLGNTAFYREQFHEALGYYQKAIDQNPDYVVAHYNMSQVHNEMLAFEKGKGKYMEAKNISQVLTEYYAQSASKYPNHPVIEERFTQRDLWQNLFLLNLHGPEKPQPIRQLFIGGISLTPFLISIILLSLALYFAYTKLIRYVSGEFCPTCHKAICVQCRESFTHYNLCGECSTLMITGSNQKVGRLPKRLRPFFIIPGGGQIVLQKTALALYMLIPFYFAITLMVVGDNFLTSEYWHLSISGSPLLPITVVFIYGIYLTDLYLRRKG